MRLIQLKLIINFFYVNLNLRQQFPPYVVLAIILVPRMDTMLSFSFKYSSDAKMPSLPKQSHYHNSTSDSNAKFSSLLFSFHALTLHLSSVEV